MVPFGFAKDDVGVDGDWQPWRSLSARASTHATFKRGFQKENLVLIGANIHQKSRINDGTKLKYLPIEVCERAPLSLGKFVESFLNVALIDRYGSAWKNCACSLENPREFWKFDDAEGMH